MIYNCLLFYKEFDLLDIRLAELGDVVDVFVIVESDVTFQGKPKPLYFEINRARYADYAPKIRHIVAQSQYMPPNPWYREMYSRDQFYHGIKDAAADDWLIINDADEIPRRSVVEALPEQEPRVLLELDFYYYTFTHKLHLPWRVPALRRHLYTDGSQARDTNLPEVPVIANAGWHFSYLGNPGDIRDKLEAFSHTEYNTAYWKDEGRIRQMIEQGRELFERDQFPIDRVRVQTGTHPAYVVANPERFAQWC